MFAYLTIRRARWLPALLMAALLAGCSLDPPAAPTRTLRRPGTQAPLAPELSDPTPAGERPQTTATTSRPTATRPTSTLPALPPTLEGALASVGDFLNASAASPADVDMAALEELVAALRGPETRGVVSGTLVLRGDLDGDGQEELVTAVQSQHDSPYGLRRGLLGVFRQAGGRRYKPDVRVYDSAYDLKLLQLADLNGDGSRELVVLHSDCGAHGCHVRPEILSWTPGQFTNLLVLTDPYGLPDAQVSLRDVDGDGRQELIANVGIVGSLPAGLERRRTEIYAWDGSQYVLDGVTYDPAASRHPYFLLVDGNAALDAGEVERAAGLYEQAIGAPYPPGAEAARDAERAAVVDAFARFRLLLTALMANDRPRAEATFRAAQDLDGAHGSWAASFWAAYQSGGELQSACKAAILEAMGHAALFEPLNQLAGTANPALGPQDLCPKGLR